MDIGKVISRFGEHSIEIAKKMIQDDELCRLLYFADEPYEQTITRKDKKKMLHKNIVINTEAPVQNNQGSYILISFNDFSRNQTNSETMDVVIFIDVIVPTEDWVLKNGNLRPYSIMEKIADIMKNVKIDSIGEVEFGGAQQVVLGNGLSGYSMKFANYQLG